MLMLVGLRKFVQVWYKGTENQMWVEANAYASGLKKYIHAQVNQTFYLVNFYTTRAFKKDTKPSWWNDVNLSLH